MTKLLPCIEWADALALKPTDLSPERRAALEDHLATCPGCAATYADYQMLMTRLRALPRPALLPLEPLTLDDFDEPDAQNHLYDTIETLLPPPEGASPPTRLPARWRRGWPQRLSLVAAVLLLTVLVGSMVGLFLVHSQGSSRPVYQPFRPHAGWNVLGQYNGIGTKTISSTAISLPTLWGLSINCTGKGNIRVQLIGPSSGGPYGAVCTTTPTTTPSPQYIQLYKFEQNQEIDAITITVDSAAKWSIQALQAAHQPELGTEWQYEGFGSSGIGSTRDDDVTGVTDVNGNPLHLQTWGVLLACIGADGGYVRFNLAGEKLPIPSCDGQARLMQEHFSVPTMIHEIEVSLPDGAIPFALEVVGCVNEQLCASD